MNSAGPVPVSRDHRRTPPPRRRRTGSPANTAGRIAAATVRARGKRFRPIPDDGGRSGGHRVSVAAPRPRDRVRPCCRSRPNAACRRCRPRSSGSPTGRRAGVPRGALPPVPAPAAGSCASSPRHGSRRGGGAVPRHGIPRSRNPRRNALPRISPAASPRHPRRTPDRPAPAGRRRGGRRKRRKGSADAASAGPDGKVAAVSHQSTRARTRGRPRRRAPEPRVAGSGRCLPASSRRLPERVPDTVRPCAPRKSGLPRRRSAPAATAKTAAHRPSVRGVRAARPCNGSVSASPPARRRVRAATTAATPGRRRATIGPKIRRRLRPKAPRVNRRAIHGPSGDSRSLWTKAGRCVSGKRPPLRNTTLRSRGRSPDSRWRASNSCATVSP